MSTTAEAGFEVRSERESLTTIFRDLWRARDLMRMLSKKNFIVRYRRASLGMLWVIGLPIIQATVIGLIFGRIARIAVDVPHYAVVVLFGVYSWSYFSGVVGGSTTAIVEGSDLATKIYFPRAVLPLVNVMAGFRGFIPGLAVIVAAAMVIFRTPVGANLALLPAAMALMLALSTGFALLFAALYVYFRDMRFIVQAIMQPWFFASGVIFPVVKFGRFRSWLELNPGVGMVDLYRASVGVAPHGWGRSVLISGIWAVLLIAISVPIYKRYNRVFVDLL